MLPAFGGGIGIVSEGAWGGLFYFDEVYACGVF